MMTGMKEPLSLTDHNGLRSRDARQPREVESRLRRSLRQRACGLLELLVHGALPTLHGEEDYQSILSAVDLDPCGSDLSEVRHHSLRAQRFHRLMMST